MGVRKSSPQLVICNLYFEVLLYVPRISNQQHLEPTELTLEYFYADQPYGPNQPRAFASHSIQALVIP